MKCPVCGNDTFAEKDYEYEICEECFWEYDILQVKNPDLSGGANRHSLNEYKKIYYKLKSENPNFSCRNEADKKRIVELDNLCGGANLNNKGNKLRNMMMYQVFVRNHSEEGTFEGVLKDLDRIKALGTNIIYLLPIHPIGEKNRKGSLGCPYAIKDYRAVNPEYGTLEDFKKLVSAIHDKGMKCIMDVVYNHTSPDSVLSVEHPEWFYHKEDGSFGNRIGDWTDVIDLDYSNEKLWEYQIDTLKYWAGIVDGFRCDVAPLVPIAFWERARKEVKEICPDCIWLAESVEPGFVMDCRSNDIAMLSDGELYRAFDICYDYDIYDEFTDYITGRVSLSTYLEAVSRQEWMYPQDYVKLRFLENHDKTRAHFLMSDEKALRNLTAFSFFQKGMAFVYSGQEYGAVHLPSLFDKDTISLEAKEGVDLTELVSRLSQIKKNEIFTDSEYSVTEVAKDICLAMHKKSDKIVIGIFSLKGSCTTVKIPVKNGAFVNEITGESIEVSNKCISCNGEPVIISFTSSMYEDNF